MLEVALYSPLVRMVIFSSSSQHGGELYYTPARRRQANVRTGELRSRPRLQDGGEAACEAAILCRHTLLQFLS